MSARGGIGLAMAIVAFALAFGTARLATSMAGQRVGIRWASSVDAQGRIRAEQAHGLRAGEDAGNRTWLYELSDRSPTAIEALVRDVAVEDTSHLDRRAMTVQLDQEQLPAWLAPLAESPLAHSPLLAVLPAALIVVGCAGLVAAGPTFAWLFRPAASRGIVRRMLRLFTAEQVPAAVPAVLALCLFAAAFHQFVTQQVYHRVNDFGVHLAYAESIHSAHDLRSPHFLFQVLIIGIRRVLGGSLVDATVLLLGAAYAGMALLLAREVERRRATQSGYFPWLIVPALLIASHVFLLTLHRKNLYWGYLVPVLYSNPTQQLNKLFALWIYMRYAARLLNAERPRLLEIPAFATLCVLSAIAKPSFLIAFLPVAGLVAVRDTLAQRWRPALVFAAGIAIPSAAILLWQASAMNDGGGMSIAFAPFRLVDLPTVLYKLPASLAFPIVVAFVALRSNADKARLRFLWWLTGLSLFYTYTLVESGPAMTAGNFSWTGQTAAFLALVESALFLLALPSGTRGRSVAWATFALHVACGVFWYASIFVFPNHDEWL